jgi:hypothetical protein
LTRERWKATRWEGFSTGLGMRVEGERKVSATFVFQSKQGYDWLFFFFFTYVLLSRLALRN